MLTLKEITHLFSADDEAGVRHLENLLTSMLVMAWMVEARDPYTGGHLWRVSQFSRALALDAGLAPNDVARIALGGFLHDLGKVGVPDHILNKRDRLTESEYAIIKTHPDLGWRVLAGHPLARLAEAAVRHHHETPDGKGYPARLTSDAIPIDAKIVGVCDAFDAMTSTRPYRNGMPIDAAISIIAENLGKQFDAELGTRLIDLARRGALDHVVGHSDVGIPLHTCPTCGPTLVIRRNARVGDHVYCGACMGEYTVQDDNGELITTYTNRDGSPVDLEPEADVELIEQLVRESAREMLAA